MRRQHDMALPRNHRRRNDVPAVCRNDVSRDEIHLRAGVGNSIPGHVAFVRIVALVHCAFHLHPDKASSMLDRKVVRSAISPRLGDRQPMLGGPHHKTQFRPFTPLLGVLYIDSLIHDGWDKKAVKL